MTDWWNDVTVSQVRAVMIRAYIMRTCLVALDLPLYPCLLATGVLLPTTHLLRPWSSFYLLLPFLLRILALP